MKSLKKVVALALSLVMLVSTMALSVSAAATDNGSSTHPNPKTLAEAGAKATVTGDFVYDGAVKKAVVEVKIGDKLLVEGTDYKVEGASQTESGTYTVTITGIGDFSGTLTGTFTIAPSKEVDSAIKTGVTTKTVKATKFKSKARTAAKFTFKSKNPGPLRVKVKGGKAKTRNGIKVVRKGKKLKVIMPKNAKKGTYTIKVRVRAYNQYARTTWKTFKVTVK